MVRSFLIGILLVFIPTRLQTDFRFRPHCSRLGTLISGSLEILIGAICWLVGFFLLGAEFSGAKATTETMSQVDSGQSRGAFLFLAVLFSHMFRPSALFWTAMLVDGVVRIADVFTNRVFRGFWLVDLGDFCWRKLRSRQALNELAEVLGEEKPDEIQVFSDNNGEVLKIYASREKDFSTRQAVSYKGELYVYESCILVERAGHKVLSYSFRFLPHTEAPRGVVIPLD